MISPTWESWSDRPRLGGLQQARTWAAGSRAHVPLVGLPVSMIFIMWVCGHQSASGNLFFRACLYCKHNQAGWLADWLAGRTPKNGKGGHVAPIENFIRFQLAAIIDSSIHRFIGSGCWAGWLAGWLLVERMMRRRGSKVVPHARRSGEVGGFL